MTTDYEKEFAQFREDIGKHAVTVLRDDGLYRHLRCSAGSYHMQFNVVTWPGYLCYCGDMGTYVFSRLADMFEFFRGRMTAMVDRSYLAQKAVAVDKPDGITAYSEERFRAAVEEDAADFAADMDDDERAEFRESVDELVLSFAGDGLERAIDAACSFVWRKRYPFSHFWEHRLEEYTARFVWCCYAIPWAIEQYDEAKTESATSVGAVDPVGEQVTGGPRA